MTPQFKLGGEVVRGVANNMATTCIGKVGLGGGEMEVEDKRLHSYQRVC